MKLRDLMPNKIRVVGFVGPSGTGKSYRAQMVAGEENIDYIIDDGILIKGNEIIARHSAKKAQTKIATVKKALFYDEQDKEEIQKALKKYKPESILILGTSDAMVQKIAQNLDLPPISKIIRITDVASAKEISDARNTRITQGKHVIPVPTFQIKKEFSGYLLDPLQIFKTKGKGKKPYVAEKSIVRPTFSYLGNFTISENVIKQIINLVADKIKGIYKINKIRVTMTDIGLDLYIEITIIYGYNLYEISQDLKQKVIKEIDKLTTMNVNFIDVRIVNLFVPNEDKKEVENEKIKDENNIKDEKLKDNKNNQDEEIDYENLSDELKFKKVQNNGVDFNKIDPINNLERLKKKIERKINDL